MVLSPTTSLAVRTARAIRRRRKLSYNRFLAAEAHTRGLLVALKNVGDLASALVKHFDFAIVEPYYQYSECDVFDPFGWESRFDC